MNDSLYRRVVVDMRKSERRKWFGSVVTLKDLGLLYTEMPWICLPLKSKGVLLTYFFKVSHLQNVSDLQISS